MEGSEGREEWMVRSSHEAKRTINPIRRIGETSFLATLAQRDQSKELVNLSYGDPARFGNLPPHHEGLEIRA